MTLVFSQIDGKYVGFVETKGKRCNLPISNFDIVTSSAKMGDKSGKAHTAALFSPLTIAEPIHQSKMPIIQG